MRILYFHGYGSSFDPENGKVKALSSLGEVVGIDIDYAMGGWAVCLAGIRAARECLPDLIVGTSMGGWLAEKVADVTGIPFVAINPSIDPHITLGKYVGKTVAYNGSKGSVMREETLNTYRTAGPLPSIFINADGVGCVSAPGLILIGMKDEVIDPRMTLKRVAGWYEYRVDEHADHRFSDITPWISDIEDFVSGCDVAGFGDE